MAPRSKSIAKIRAFNRFYTNLIGVLDRRFLDSPYSLTEIRILYEIYTGTETTARDIRNFLHVDEGYLSRTIDGLVGKGMVERKRKEIDARMFALSLSEAGEKEFQELNARSDASISSLIEGLEKGEISLLLESMATIERILGGKEVSHDVVG